MAFFCDVEGEIAYDVAGDVACEVVDDVARDCLGGKFGSSEWSPMLQGWTNGW